METTLFCLLLTTFFPALIYKAYLDLKIEDPDSKVSIVSMLAFHQYGASIFLPWKLRTTNEKDRKLRRKANKAIFVVYMSVAATLLLSLFYK